MEKTLSFQLTGEIAKKFEKEKKDFEAKIGCKTSWTQFFSMREQNVRDAAWAECEKACGPAWAEYKKARDKCLDKGVK